MLIKGVEFMIIGMTVVFSFLVVMVLVMNCTHLFLKFFNRFFPENEALVSTGTTKSNEEIAAAIAAVKAFQKK